MRNPKFKPNQLVSVIDVKNASGVGYLGTYHNICDYVSSPSMLKYKNEEPLYLCESINGHFTWFYESELKG